MTYPHRPPPPYRTGMSVEASKVEVTHHVRDPFGVAFKATMGIMAALFIAGLLTTMAWLAVFSALVAGAQGWP